MTMPISTRALTVFWSRRRSLAKKRLVPFNLKDVDRSCRAHLVRPLFAQRPGWLGPWVDLGVPASPQPLSRLFLYTLNAAKLWLACPASQSFTRGYNGWLSAALRGLGGLASLKLRFKGKSFRWHRRRNALVLRFGHSHLVACRPPLGTKWKRGGKTKMLFFSSNLTLLREYLMGVVAWREPNRYHSRGLRLSRQRITRKSGKVSAYR